MDAQPFDAIHLREALQQFGQGTPPVQVQAVIGRVLGDDDQLLHALRGEGTGLRDEVLHRDGTVRPPYPGDGAIGAGTVAAFGNLQVGRPGPVLGQDPSAATSGDRRHTDGVQHRIQVAGAEPGVHFGDQARQLVRIALRQAAENDQFPGLAALPTLSGFQDGLDGLLLGIADEAAGVEQQVINISGPFASRNHIERIPRLKQEMLGVDGVLRAAERDDLERGLRHPLPPQGQFPLPRQSRAKRTARARCTSR